MSISIQCANCKKELRVKDELAGKRIKCPACGQAIIAPTAPAAEAPAARKNTAEHKDDSEAPPTYPSSERFDGPRAKAERLFVLTGGLEPKAVITTRQATAIHSKLANTVQLVDLVFTDVGLLIAKYGTFYSGSATVLAGGLAGVIGAGIAEVRARSKAARVAAQHNKSKLLKLYGELGEFLPADELSKFVAAENGNIVVKFRGDEYLLAGKGLEVATLNDWRKQARDNRRNAPQTHPNPGILALIEWGSRPEDDNPPWIKSTIKRCIRHKVVSANFKTVRAAGDAMLGKLQANLTTLSDPSSVKLRDQLRPLQKAARNRESLRYLIVGPLVIVLSIAMILLLTLGGGPRGEEVTILCILALMLPLGVVLLGIGLAKWMKA